jgi:hypothetical protein
MHEEALKELSQENESWFVHVLGPDDIHKMPDELSALRNANELNKMFSEFERTEFHPICWAVAKICKSEKNM